MESYKMYTYNVNIKIQSSQIHVYSQHKELNLIKIDKENNNLFPISNLHRGS